MKKISNILRAPFAPALLASVLAVSSAFGGTEQWAGVPGVSATINWSDANNWTGLVPPQTYYNQVQFTGTGASPTNDFAVNNELDYTQSGVAQMPIWELDFVPLNGNYTTQIDPGVTLNLGAGRGFLLVGADQLNTGTPAAANAVETITLTGSGGALNMVGTMWVGQGSPTPNDVHNVTLDMSGLGNFTDSGPSGGENNEILVASGGAARTDGSLFLAETNSITLGNDFLVCNQTFSNSVPCVVYLGQQNSILTGTGNLTIGGFGTSSAGAWMKFNPAFLGGATAPAATFGGTAGDGRIVNFWISDANSTPQISGWALCDFSGGNVSLSARSMQLGQAGNAGANATGTLTLDDGVVDVNDAIIGNQEVSSGGVAVGIINLNTNSAYGANATLRVNDLLTLGAVSGTPTSGSEGVININGGALVANDIANGGGAAIINSTNGSISLTGVAGSAASPLTSVTLVNSALTLAFDRSEPNIVASSLATGGSGNVINITAVPPSPSYPVQITLIKYSGSINGAGYNFALGTVPQLCLGFVSNNVANNSIDLVLTQGPLTLTWTGAIDGNWDTTTANWTAGGPVDYSDGAFVQFLDGANASSVDLTETLSPGGTTVSNNALTYTFSGSGSLSGSGALVKSGSGTLILDNTGNNNFTGGLDIEQGTLQVGNGDANGGLPAGNIQDDGTLAFDRTDSPTINNAISGSGGLTLDGAGSTVHLSGGNTFTGTVLVTNGSVVQLNNSSALGAGGEAIIASGSTLDANAYSATKTLLVSGTGFNGQGALTSSGTIYDNPGPGVGTNIVLTGDATFTYPTRWDLGSANGGSVLTASGPYNLTLNGSGYFEWRNLSVQAPLANIDIAAGNLGVTGNMTFGDPNGSLIIENGSALTIYGAAVVINKNVDFQNGATINNAYGANTMTGNMTVEAGFGTVSVGGGTTLIVSNALSGSGVFYISGGSGTTILAGNSPAFTGGVQLYSGQLTLNGSVGSGVLAQSGTSLTGNGSAGGLVDVSGAFNPGGIGVAGTFTAAGGLTLESGATITMDLSPNVSSANDAVAVTGNLTVNGNTININPLTGVLASGTYPLFTYTGSLNGSFAGASTVASSRYTFSLDTSTPHQVNLIVTGTADLLSWNNGSGDGAWDVQSSLNWSNHTTHVEDQFFTSDLVSLDDSIKNSANPSPNLNIPSGVIVIPSLISNNSTVNYTIGGAGDISGGASILKLGSSELTISSTNDFSGDTTIAGGSVEITGQLNSANSPLGSANGTIFITNGSTLFINLVGGYAGGDSGFGAKPIVVSGAGVNGLGAIQNIGNPLYDDSATLGLGQKVTMTGDTTIGGAARLDWGYPGNGDFLSTGGSNYNLTIIENQYFRWVDFSIDTNLGNIDISNTGSSGYTWELDGMGGSLGNPTNILTLHSNVEMQIVHGSEGYPASADSGYAKIVHVTSGCKFVFQPGGGNGDYRLATGFILDTNAEQDFFSGNGGNGTGTVISGKVVLNGLAHIQIGDSSVTFSNVISGPGGFYWDNYNNDLVFTAANTYQGITDIRSGRTLVLAGNGSISASSPISLASSATLDVSQRPDQTLTVASSQTLEGSGSVAGNLIVNGTLAPGGTNSTGNFTVNNAVTLDGTTIMEINAGGPSFDQLTASSIQLGGNLVLPVISGTLALGNSFQLFNAPSITGSFASITPAPGPGLAWSLSGGVATVVGAATQPSISNIVLTGNHLVFGGQDAAAANSPFNILGTTNIALPLTNWSVISSGTVDASGNFSATNSVGTNGQTFYILQIK